MRIALVSSKGYGGGGAVQLLLLGQGLMQRGHEVCFLVPEGKGWEEHLWKHGLEAEFIPFQARVQAFAVLKRIIRERNFQIMQFYKGRELTLALLARGFKSMPKLVAYRGVNFPLDFFTARKYALADKVVAVSGAVKGSLLRAGVPEGKIEVVYGCVDERCFKPAEEGEKSTLRREFGLGEEDFVIAYVASFRPGKGQEAIVEIARVLKDKGLYAHWLCAGGGEKHLMDELKRTMEREGLGDRLHILGYREDVEKIYKCADVSLVLSRSEGLAGVLRESLACGVPIVATDTGGNRELIKDGRTGFLIKPGDWQHAAKCVLELARNPHLACKIGEAGRKLVLENFTVDKRVEKMESLYKRLLEAENGA